MIQYNNRSNLNDVICYMEKKEKEPTLRSQMEGFYVFVPSLNDF